MLHITSTDIPLDNNNNDTPEQSFGAGINNDSGLGIFSTQSEESDTNISRSAGYHHTDHHKYTTITFPVEQSETNSPDKRWNSVLNTNRDTSLQPDSSINNIIELKTLDNNNNMSTSIVIYRNHNREFRHINIIDYRPKYSSKVKRSNTFSNDKNSKKNPSSHDELLHSFDNLPLAQKDMSTDNLCSNLSKSSSLSDQVIQNLSIDESHDKGALKSKSRFWQKLVSTFCCHKHTQSESSDDEIETCLDSSPPWKFSFDHFDDVTYICSGAQGTIYTATFNNVKVALKKVKEIVNRDEIHIEHLLSLKHTNIITFLGVCEEPDKYIVMEFCSQGQLFDRLHREVQISPQNIGSWAYQICDGMTYLHKRDIIHRDLKSPNILITDDNFLKIIDFEFSKDCCENKKFNSFVGTIAWMAPEVLREEVHTKNVDVWSYGVVLWELITREIPYFGIEKMSILFGVGSNNLYLPLCDSIPTELNELISSCWNKIPEKRLSFEDILKNFDKYFETLEKFSQEQFTTMQKEWKCQIEDHFKKMDKEKISLSRVETELIKRRTRELNEARKIKKLYNEKSIRADELIALLYKCLEAVTDERKRNDSEWRLIQKLKQSILPTPTNPDNNNLFYSLPFPNGTKSIRILTDNCQKTQSPSLTTKNDKLSHRHSVVEPTKNVDRMNTVRRKHSVPTFMERNNFPTTTKTKVIE